MMVGCPNLISGPTSFPGPLYFQAPTYSRAGPGPMPRPMCGGRAEAAEGPRGGPQRAQHTGRAYPGKGGARE